MAAASNTLEKSITSSTHCPMDSNTEDIDVAGEKVNPAAVMDSGVDGGAASSVANTTNVSVNVVADHNADVDTRSADSFISRRRKKRNVRLASADGGFLNVKSTTSKLMQKSVEVNNSENSVKSKKRKVTASEEVLPCVNEVVSIGNVVDDTDAGEDDSDVPFSPHRQRKPVDDLDEGSTSTKAGVFNYYSTDFQDDLFIHDFQDLDQTYEDEEKIHRLNSELVALRERIAKLDTVVNGEDDSNVPSSPHRERKPVDNLDEGARERSFDYYPTDFRNRIFLRDFRNLWDQNYQDEEKINRLNSELVALRERNEKLASENEDLKRSVRALQVAHCTASVKSLISKELLSFVDHFGSVWSNLRSVSDPAEVRSTVAPFVGNAGADETTSVFYRKKRESRERARMFATSLRS